MALHGFEFQKSDAQESQRAKKHKALIVNTYN